MIAHNYIESFATGEIEDRKRELGASRVQKVNAAINESLASAFVTWQTSDNQTFGFTP